MRPRSQQQFRVTATIDGTDVGVFKNMSGGESEAEINKIREGGGEEEIPLTAPKSVSDITLTRVFRAERDMALTLRWHERTGVAEVTVKKQPLDDDLNAFGQPRVFTGVLQKCGEPDSDANSSDPAEFDIEISTASRVA